MDCGFGVFRVRSMLLNYGGIGMKGLGIALVGSLAVAGGIAAATIITKKKLEKENDEDYMNAVDYMFAGLEKRKPDCFAVKQYKKYKLASGDVCSK